jgi:ATP-binding cassette subfamily C protein CydC
MTSDPLWRALRVAAPGRRRIAVAIALGIAASGSALALSATSAWLIARAWEMPPVLMLSVAVVSVRALGISRGVLRYLERLSSHDAALGGTTNARISIYRQLAVGDPAVVSGTRRGELLTRTGDDVERIAEVLVRAVVPMSVALVMAVAATTIVAFISVPAATVLALALLVAAGVAPWLASRGARLTQSRTADARTEFASYAATLLEHCAELRVTGRLESMLDEARAAANTGRQAADGTAWYSSLSAATIPLATGFAVIAALVTALGTEALSPMSLAIMVLLPLAATEIAAALPTAAVELGTAREAATRLMDLLDRASAPAAFGGAEPVESTTIEVARLKYGWPGRPAAYVPNVSIPPGGRVAVIGPSGSGKTSLLMTLAGLLQPIEGEVLIGKTPTTALDPAELRTTVSFFAEDGHIFRTSIFENLRVANGGVAVADAWRALAIAGLDDWVRGLPEGIEQVLTEGERSISAGQRRRLLLARALVSPARVLLLDEPTENLDDVSSRTLLDYLLDPGADLLLPGRTVVLSTHAALPSNGKFVVIEPANSVRGAAAAV